jgi:hypothetical protein
MTDSTITNEEKIAAIGAQQKANKWAERQDSARNQQAQAERQSIERYRTNRIAAIQIQLNGIPARIKNASAMVVDADELASVWASQVDCLANNYAMRLHGARHSASPVRLELGSPEAHAYFSGSEIKKSLRQLALTANNRSFGNPLPDVESLAAELRDEEKRLREELAELKLG